MNIPVSKSSKKTIKDIDDRRYIMSLEHTDCVTGRFKQRKSVS